MSVRVQVLVREPEQLHPGPEAAVGVSPSGIASRTVTVLPPTGSGSLGSSLVFVTTSVSVAVCPWTNVDGLWVAEMSIGSGATNHGSGGVPGRSMKLYGTGFSICGIGLPVETYRSATTWPVRSTLPQQ